MPYYNIQNVQFSIKKIARYAKKRKYSPYTEKEKQLIKTVLEKVQTLDLQDSNFKLPTLNMSKELKETMRAMSHTKRMSIKIYKL